MMNPHETEHFTESRCIVTDTGVSTRLTTVLSQSGLVVTRHVQLVERITERDEILPQDSPIVQSRDLHGPG